MEEVKFFVYVEGKNAPCVNQGTHSGAIFEAKRLANKENRVVHILSTIQKVSPDVNFDKINREDLEEKFGVIIVYDVQNQVWSVRGIRFNMYDNALTKAREYARFPMQQSCGVDYDPFWGSRNNKLEWVKRHRANFSSTLYDAVSAFNKLYPNYMGTPFSRGS